MTDEARWRLLVLAACAVALVLRLAAVGAIVGFHAPPDRRADLDQVDYEATGWELAQGHGFRIAGEPTWFRPPGTSLAIAAVYAIARRSYASLRVVLALLSALTCGAVAVAGRRAFGATTGALAAWLLAVDPAHGWYALHFGSETFYGLAIAAATALGVLTVHTVRRPAGTAENAAPPLGAGLLLGFAILVRPQAAFAVPLALALACLAPRSWRAAAIRAALLVTLAAALLPVCWMTRNAVRFGHFALAAVGATTLYGANNAQALADPALCGSWASQRLALGAPALPRDETVYADRSLTAARTFARDHWRELPRLEACKVGRLVSPLLATPSRTLAVAFAASWALVAPLALVGLWSGWRRDRAATAVVALPLGALLLTALVFYGSIRFRHSSEPVLVLLAAQGLAVVIDSVRRRPSLDLPTARP